MRSCLIQLLMAFAVVFALLWFGLPFGASWLATNALTAAGFTGTDTRVEVKADLPPRILTGHADSIRVTSTSVGVGDLHAESIDLTLGNVDLFSRTLDTVNGTLSGVHVIATDGQTVTIDSVAIDGSAKSATSTLTLSHAEAARLAEQQLSSRGLVGKVALSAPDKVVLTINGRSEPGRLAIRNQALVLVPNNKSLPTLILLAPGDGNPFALTSVSVGATSVTLVGTLDVDKLLGL
jgi:hypothetical protein